jgi:hypothetical protein
MADLVLQRNRTSSLLLGQAVSFFGVHLARQKHLSALLGDEMLALLGDKMFALLGDKMFALIGDKILLVLATKCSLFLATKCSLLIATPLARSNSSLARISRRLNGSLVRISTTAQWLTCSHIDDGSNGSLARILRRLNGSIAQSLMPAQSLIDLASSTLYCSFALASSMVYRSRSRWLIR